MITSTLKKIIAHQSLTQPEAAETLEYLISDDATDAQIAGVLTALACKGETEDELAGFAQAMRKHCLQISAGAKADYIDTCGTGGSIVKTFNVSTAVAFVVAAAGLAVAKHGNVGVTTRAGSADVLKALDVETKIPLELVQRCFDEIDLCFMFAPAHHSATKRVAKVRRELGVRTLFNLLGPLTNPAAAPYQIIGVSDALACERVAKALTQLGTRKAWVVRGTDGLDEISLAAPTVVYEATANGVKQLEISPADFGFKTQSMQSLQGGDAQANAQIILSILRNERTDGALELVLVNAAAALMVSGKVDTLLAGVQAAREAIISGAASSKYQALQRLTSTAQHGFIK